jgi:putative phosphoribosyl transferase
VAQALGAPLDIVAVRKIGAPGNPEFAIGALVEGDASTVSSAAVRFLGLDDVAVDGAVSSAKADLRRLVARYRVGHPQLPVTGRTVLLVDDGLATGSSALAAARSLRKRGAVRVILGVPVAAAEALGTLSPDVDDVICVEIPRPFRAVGNSYANFDPTPDAEVEEILARDYQLTPSN